MSRGRAQGRRARTKRTPKEINKAARAAAGHSHTDAGPDQIVCLLCGETYRAITYKHLRFIHGFEGEHPIRDYKERFGLRVAACEESCELRRDVQVERYKKAGRHWTKARILREIRKRRSSRHGLAHSRAPLGLTIAARRMFGSWDAALKAAGVDPAVHRFTNAWDVERLTRAIRRHARGGRAVTASWVKGADPELHGAAIRLLGNWTEAIRAAGLEVRVHREPKRWAMDRVVAWVKATHAAGGDIRSIAAPAGAQDRVRSEMGLTWRAFVESIGIPYPGPRKRLDWSDKGVLGEIRRRRRQGLPLNAEAVVRDVGQSLVQQARKRLGGWDEALKAAGVDPAAVRLSRTWTKADVIAGIKKRKAAGRSMAFKTARVEEPRLVKAAQRLFPSSWGKALAAAGLDPGLARVDGPAGRQRTSRTPRPRKRK